MRSETADDVRIIHGDCRAVLPTLADGSVDAIVTDPPYGTEVERDGYGRRQKWQGDQKIENDNDLGILVAVLPEFRRLVKPNGWVVMFCSPKRRDDVGEACRKHGLNIRGEAIWDKRSPGLGGGIRYQHEAILFGSFGSPIGRCGLSSVLSEWMPKGQNGHRQQRHVHEKPVGVLTNLIRYASDAAGLILDPFAGSGSTAVACLKTGRRCIAIESDAKYIPTIQRRVDEARTPLFAEVASS
jgi:adenine-specific DNA-methyltransferase